MITPADVSVICPSKGRRDNIAKLLFTIPQRPLHLVVTGYEDIPPGELRGADVWIKPTLGVCQAAQFGIEQCQTKCFVLICDDVAPEVFWLENAIKAYNDNLLADDLGGLVHIQHGMPRHQHLAVFPFISKKFYMELLYPVPYHKYRLDDEITFKAKALGRYVRAVNSTLKHDHTDGHDWAAQERDDVLYHKRIFEFLGTVPNNVGAQDSIASVIEGEIAQFKS